MTLQREANGYSSAIHVYVSGGVCRAIETFPFAARRVPLTGK